VQSRMKKIALSFLFLTFTSLLSVSIFACSSDTGKFPNSTISVGQPYLDTSEAIGLAKQDALEHPKWAGNANLASSYVSSSNGWNAKYDKNGKWTVELRTIKSDGATMIIFRWSVLETGLQAVYIGQFSERKPDISSQLSVEEVIKGVKDVGVPGCSSTGIATPIGTWTAVHNDSEGLWYVTGIVEINEGGKLFQVSTGWKCNGYTIILDKFIKQ